jgi:hypothetical protein
MQASIQSVVVSRRAPLLTDLSRPSPQVGSWSQAAIQMSTFRKLWRA